MDEIRLTVRIGRERRIDIELPPDTPTGPALLVVTFHTDHTNPAREAARLVLQEAATLGGVLPMPEQAPALTEEERERVWARFSAGRSADELIDEDRGSW